MTTGKPGKQAKTKAEKPKRAVIYIDNREMKSGVIEQLAEFDVEVRQKQLKVGDYICSDRVCIERKTVSDFLGSVLNQRIFDQLNGLSESFERPVLILEGSPHQLFSERKIHANAIRGMLTTIAVDFGIPIIWTNDAAETAAQVFWIANREQVLEKKEPTIRSNKKARTTQDLQEYIVAGLPSVNSKLSRRLLEEFRSVKEVFKADEENLMKIDKIGKEKAKKICEVLNREYES
ncbi:MAG: ERCC4 domain-containing protein [Candidatus Thorarchaeota archaeon]|jgi:Fanconi anemia group M protein